jgi:outer membrane protein assembly factor BamD
VELDPGGGMRRLGLLLLLVLVAGCATRRVDLAKLAANSDRVIWEAGQEASTKKDWESARQYYRRLIDGFPQSPLGPDARLALADTYFKEGGAANMILAVSAYREFLTFYPSNPQSDYAQYQIAESYFRQRHPPDRDQGPTSDALKEFQRFLEMFPDSPRAEDVRQRIIECRQSLARAEYLVGSFYQRSRHAYRAAIARYEGIVDNYPDYQELDQVLFHLGEALLLSLRPAEAAPFLARLIQDFPDSPLVGDAQRLLDEAHAAAESQPQSPQAADAPPPQ